LFFASFYRGSRVIAGGYVLRKFPNVDGESRVKSQFDLFKRLPHLVNADLFANKPTAILQTDAHGDSKSFFMKISSQEKK